MRKRKKSHAALVALLLLCGIAGGFYSAAGNRQKTVPKQVSVQLAEAGGESSLTSTDESEGSPFSDGEKEVFSLNSGSLSSHSAEDPLFFRLTVPYISQKGLLPTGCEAVSAMMLLRHYGFSTKINDFVENDLPKQPFWEQNGVLYGPHPADAFVGDPYSEEGFGCYAPVIVKALQNAVGEEMQAKDTTGTSLPDLMQRYVRKGDPVLIWASMNMRELKKGREWIVASTGETFVWTTGEHCLVLIGEDAKGYWFNDPYEGNGVIRFSKELVKARFQSLGLQSVVLEKTDT